MVLRAAREIQVLLERGLVSECLRATWVESLYLDGLDLVRYPLRLGIISFIRGLFLSSAQLLPLEAFGDLQSPLE